MYSIIKTSKQTYIHFFTGDMDGERVTGFCDWLYVTPAQRDTSLQYSSMTQNELWCIVKRRGVLMGKYSTTPIIQTAWDSDFMSG